MRRFLGILAIALGIVVCGAAPALASTGAPGSGTDSQIQSQIQ
ncbi:hypothetical protein [Pseudonocardia sp. GCM10023141]